MYKNKYQFGKYLSLLDIQEKESIQKWGVTGGNLKKAYDKTVKGYVYITDQNMKLSLPGKPQDLFLLQTYLTLQCKILFKQSFNIEVQVTDSDLVKRRLFFSGATDYTYSQPNIVKTIHSVRIPSSLLLEGVWLNLQFDLLSFIQNSFEPFKLRSVDQITIGGACLLRKVYTSQK